MPGIPMSPPSGRTSYDEIPYPSRPYPQTHPDRLATVATLLGLRPAPADRCRVLELGCGSGGNLIPMALGLPQSTFLGIDLSASEVARGRATVQALGLGNVEMRQLSILEVDEGFGTFDYILCHGVYSWVPAEVQAKILDICARHLTREGIGYVSYNVYPGWHVNRMVREMLGCGMSRGSEEPPEQRVAGARTVLGFLARAAPQQEGAYAQLLREQLDVLRDLPDAYLFHEYLEEHNTPVYFLEFCEVLAARGLRYLGESAFHTMVAAAPFPPDVSRDLEELAPTLLEKEQYLDFLRNRSFRQTLLCRDHLKPSYDGGPDRLQGFHVAAPLTPVSPTPVLASPAMEIFKGLEDIQLTTAVPVVKMALVILGELWPKAVRFTELPALARQRLGLARATDADTQRQDLLALGKVLLTAYAGAGELLVLLSLTPPAFTEHVSERPVASPLARLQATSGLPITNLRHGTTTVAPLDRHLLPLLDGTRDRPALVQALVGRFEQGLLPISRQGMPVTDSATARALLSEALEQQLPRLAKAALLLA
jgi:methyltransferase-like protein/cyclopropane fatty-acyl-phospholipid synthase-like methyltransferase